MDIQNEFGYSVNINHFEVDEQEFARVLLKDTDVVLELGARYGSVSCILNSKLSCKTNQVSVEPDSRVWAALERNKQVNQCEFHIVKGFLSKKKLGLVQPEYTEYTMEKGYATTTVEQEDTQIPSYSLDEIQKTYQLQFNVLFADCEGFLETFFDENPGFMNQLRLVCFEADFPDKCDYTKIKCKLMESGFVCFLDGFQNVWVKSG